ncbi:LOW QUALITY PROTEIN: cilia- and flagella-associated protein 54 [Perognathus longimembris pacificus]|uniref:LOW QUALITY PROTEIN: cilia- and flagella-associated protein 54 n=1 Tax=Perognathus longimembris pacificus TaxID=214514 RepID=UPI002019B70F|nr:LOW QUALITY PROTEIN: cilia- and flagella-associated protein 54 [Perognathus longimembris pacificus]
MAASVTLMSSPSDESPSTSSPPELPPTPPPTSTALLKSPQESKASWSPFLRRSCPEDKLPTAAFYGPLDAKNPLLASFEKEIRELLGFMKKKKALATTEEQKDEFRRRCATTLFNIWTKYAPRLPADYYNEKLLKVGDSLCQIKEYKLALLQCYGRYLQQFSTSFDENGADVNQFKSIFFPKGFGDETAGLTFHALSGKSICSYKLVCDSDINLQNKESVKKCLNLLYSIRLIMQVALPQEHLCWIIFNSTIYIYTICRKLMVIGQASQALEYLLWASICMESSVPLLSVRYLTWRATLYTAVCQCYYDCQAGIHGEAFARRALAKIDELRQLELMSSSKSEEESRRYYREATLKMAVMIFKRGVFETRRKSKALFRPKIRINIKEIQNTPWPRTVTERLLEELFDGTPSRFLAVLEALSDSNRRVLQTGPVATDEVELRDVVAELFMAGKELLVIANTGASGKFDFPRTSLLECMVEKKNVISMDAALKFIKLAFTYEEWSLFESSAMQLLLSLEKENDPESKKAEKDLILLIAVEPLINVKKSRGLILPLENDKEWPSIRTYLKKFTNSETSLGNIGSSEDIFQLSAILYFCVCDSSSKNVQPDKEIVLDILTFLWQKCKVGIQKINVSKYDYSKYTQKISTNKWIYLLWQISEVIHSCKMEDIDVVVIAEVTLRLCEILECLGSPKRKFKKSQGTLIKRWPEELPETPKGVPEIIFILKKKPVEQLLYAYELLDKAISGINLHYMLTTLPSGSPVIDHCYVKCSHDTDGDTYKPISENTFIMDLHLELIQAQHRIAVALLDQLHDLQMPTDSKSMSTRSSEKLKKSRSSDCFTELSVMNKIKQNKLSKAVYLMQKALLLFETNMISTSAILMEAYSLIEKVETEQSALYSYQKYLEISKTKKSRIPPPPILLSRTHCSVTLKPAPFISDVKVSWYCILGCKAEGSYGKVRLNNNHLPNSGEAIPADGKTIFEVKGLETNENYIFAIAAYCSNGKLIGDAIGETTKPILVYPPLSAITARMYLTQVAYQIGNYKLAKKVFSPAWDYFVASPLRDEQSIVSLSNIMTITQRRLHSYILTETSSILLYLFLRNIFVTSDIKIKEENLFCDNIKGNEIFPAQQIARLMECERILVALELSTFLNDSNYALQAVTQCYGLLAPIIYHNIVLVPVIQILIKCIVVMQGLPSILFSKKQLLSYEGVQHMIACCIFYITKILRSWKEYDLAIMMINYGKRMLDITPSCRSLFGFTEPEEVVEENSSKKPLKPKKPQQVILPEKVNEQLAMLESHLLRLTKPYMSSDLSGAEDPIFLYPVVLNWGVKNSVKEVMKFKQRPRFLEFFTQVMLKCMNDEKFHILLEITGPVHDFLKRRNEVLLGVKKQKYKDHMFKKTAKYPKKFKAVIIEITKSSEVGTRKRRRRKEPLKDFFSRNPNLLEIPEQERYKRADVRKVAYRCLRDCLTPIVVNYIRKKRLHQIFLEEMPWRAQMNLFLASAHYHLLLQKLGERVKPKPGTSPPMVSFRTCDPNLFSLYNSGTILPTAKLSIENYKGILYFLSTKKNKGNLSSDEDEFSEFLNCKANEESLCKPKIMYDSDSQLGLNVKDKDRASNLGLDHFMKTFLYCRRAMVLAHRGGYWTLLQNCCRVFWNFTQELQILLKQAVDLYKTFSISQDGFLCSSVIPFSLGAELLIDMLIQLQNSKSLKFLEEKGEFSVLSCYGNIKYENGGSSLTFEHPLDDINVVDLKWIHDFVLKALEVLYQVEKWETLVSLAIQFNIITHERYTEQVTPLLVYAQRQLLLRIEKFQGPDISQQPCARYEAEHKEKVTCRNFIGKQLKIDPSSSKVIETGTNMDLLQVLIYSEYIQAKQLLCVPVDVTDTLRCFRESLGKSTYHNRSIRHSRKLLSLFLVQTQGDKGRVNSPTPATKKVEFSLGTEEIHMSIPPDLSQEQFRVSSAVEKSKLPYSQLGLVISSYHQTIDILQASNQRSLKVQALHSLGSLLIFAKKKRAAFKCWCQALDDLFRKTDVLHTWKEFGTSPSSPTHGVGFKDYSEEFLSKVGIWGCLQGAVIAAKIAQFIKTVNIEKRINCCLLSALLFQGLLRTTLPHPKADRCYAQYEITQLLPGIELFSDRFRADICSVIASLYYIIRELHFAKHNLIILPLLALYQYFVSVICQDLVRNLEARILKIEVLIDLGFFSEAFYELAQIFYGKNMPCSIPAGFKATGKIKLFQSFDSGKPLNSKENLQALDELMSKGQPLTLITLGQQHLLNKFYFVKAYFFISLAAAINSIPDYSFKQVCRGVATEKNKANAPNPKGIYSRDSGTSTQYIKFKEEVTLCTLKAVLLLEAEDRLNFLVSEMEHTVHKNLTQCSAGDLEIVVESRLQLAEISLQRHRAAYSAAILCSTLNLLQDSKLFKKKAVEDERESPASSGNSVTEIKDDNEFLDPVSLNAREYFNIHLWLRCRLALVTAFVAQIRGIGIVKENDMTDCMSLINEVCMEAKNAGNKELEAEFLMQAVILGLQEKHLKADIIGHLQDIIHLLEGNEFISPRSWLTLARSLLLLDDLTKARKFKECASLKSDKLFLLTQAHHIIIEQMLTFGETIEYPLSNTEYANPLEPLKNIYLPHIMLLAKIKMRIGHTLAKQVYYTNRKKDFSKWLPALRLFEMALKLCKVSAIEECEVEAEILFQKGKVERQILMEDKSPNIQLDSFFEAIQLSLKNDQNSGLIRDSYLEMALYYFNLKKPMKKNSATSLSFKNLSRRHSSNKEPSNKFEMCTSLAWIAIRAAAQVSESVLEINLLIGKKNSRSDEVNQVVLPNIPEFATVDLLSSYTDYFLDNYQVTFQTSSSFLFQNEDTYESIDGRKRTQTKVDITWVLLLRYYIHLQRINNMSQLLASTTPESGISLPDDTLITSIYNSGLLLRQKEMHFYLKKVLHFYSSSCIDEFPKELLQGFDDLHLSKKDLSDSSINMFGESSIQSILSLKLAANLSYMDVSSSEMATQALNKELCFQWYLPPLDRPPRDIFQTEPMVILLYAYNVKPVKISDIKQSMSNNVYVGFLWVSLNRVISIHEKLSDLAQIAEISLPSVPEITSKGNINESLDVEEKPIDTDMENMIIECCSEIVSLFLSDGEKTPLTEKLCKFIPLPKMHKYSNYFSTFLPTLVIFFTVDLLVDVSLRNENESLANAERANKGSEGESRNYTWLVLNEVRDLLQRKESDTETTNPVTFLGGVQE